jgi:small subunit ribosomal protein S3
MGHKVHPFGFRLGYIRDWQTHWFADRAEQYRTNLLEDLQIRDHIVDKHRDAAVARVELERKASEVRALIHTARPGVVIGRGGQRVEELRQELENLTGKRVRVDINEIRQPELEAALVAQSIADQIQRQVSFRRATRQAVQRSMQAGAQGIRVAVSGRLGGAEIARTEKAMDGRVPLHTLRADIDFGTAEARTQMGQIGVKVWVYRGDIVTEATPEELARRSALMSTPVASSADGAVDGAAAVAEAPTPENETPVAEAEATAPESDTPTEVETPAAETETPAAEDSAPAETEDASTDEDDE